VSTNSSTSTSTKLGNWSNIGGWAQNWAQFLSPLRWQSVTRQHFPSRLVSSQGSGSQGPPNHGDRGDRNVARCSSWIFAETFSMGMSPLLGIGNRKIQGWHAYYDLRQPAPQRKSNAAPSRRNRELPVVEPFHLNQKVGPLTSSYTFNS
jgi:hypothetical protein